MATKVFFLNSNSAQYGEEEWNHVQKFFFVQGVLNTQGADWADFIDLKVAQKSSPNMSVDVKVGAALVEITRSGATFKVFAFNLAQVNLAIGSNSSGSNRVDAVIMRIDVDTDPNALMNNIATIQVVPGTGASPLSDGAIQTAIGNDGFIRLANVTVANGATSIVTGNISDTRARAATTDQVTYSPTVLRFHVLTADPSTSILQPGDVWYNSTVDQMKYYDGVNIIPVESHFTAAGVIQMFAGSAIPTGWLECDGQSYLRADYPDLFTAISTTYGAADGTHFNVPNLKGRVPVGLDSGQTEFDTMGETGGENTHVLITSEMPSHSHGLTLGNGSAGGTLHPRATNDNSTSGDSTGGAGGDGAHNNLQPYIVLKFMIKF